MKAYFFISDVHLGAHAANTDIREKELMALLDCVEQEGDGLFIVGDLFDFWFEYQYVIPKHHFDLLCRLKQLIERGIEIHYLVGNHDFWLGSFFKETLGIQLHLDTYATTLNGKQVYLTHGDGIAKNDRGYRILKRILRNPFNIKLFNLLHPDIGFKLAGQSSHISRTYRDVPDHDSDYIEFAKQRFKEGHDVVVIGHTHRPIRIEENGSVYINTGDWITHFTYGKMTGNQITLEHWSTISV